MTETERHLADAIQAAFEQNGREGDCEPYFWLDEGEWIDELQEMDLDLIFID